MKRLAKLVALSTSREVRREPVVFGDASKGFVDDAPARLGVGGCRNPNVRSHDFVSFECLRGRAPSVRGEDEHRGAHARLL